LQHGPGAGACLVGNAEFLGYGRRKSIRTIIEAGAHPPAEGKTDRCGVVERKTGATAISGEMTK
jgi:hypothetical protein